MSFFTGLVILVVLILLSVKLTKWEERRRERISEPLKRQINEYEEKLKRWCEKNHVVFKEHISTWHEIRVNEAPGYLWFNNKDIVFCPDAICCGNPINIEKNIIFIKYEDIKYYTKDGTISYTNEIINNGKNISVSGAVIGGLIAGDAGAIIGSRKDMNKIENVTVKHDEVHTYMYYKHNGDIKLLDIEGADSYQSILHKMPEKEYYYLMNKNNM